MQTPEEGNGAQRRINIGESAIFRNVPTEVLHEKGAEIAELSQHSPKPANFIPRDGLLARCVRMLAAEGYSQARIARELRLNKRTVSRLME